VTDAHHGDDMLFQVVAGERIEYARPIHVPAGTSVDLNSEASYDVLIAMTGIGTAMWEDESARVSPGTPVVTSQDAPYRVTAEDEDLDLIVYGVSVRPSDQP
jgi:mannose-6-phosphate isomerase-like protein (cupin superfamily)